MSLSFATERASRVRFSDIRRNAIIAAMAFLTVVDLFAAQAVLPSLARAYAVTPAVMGLAVNACTLGMAAASLAVALVSPRIERRLGILVSLCALVVPTILLAFAPNIVTFAALRIMQGLCMASAFTLTLAYLGENCASNIASGAFAAYIAGNVGSNLFGRIASAALVEHFGLIANFIALGLLNLLGGVLVLTTIRSARLPAMAGAGNGLRGVRANLVRSDMRAAFLVGFCILFAFIGAFTYVNFVLVRAPLDLTPMSLGLVYLVFAPSLATTLAAGAVVQRIGARMALRAGLAIAAAGAPLTLAPSLPPVLFGLALVGVGTFFAQAVTSGYVGRNATEDRGAASGLYLASYFLGGLVGAAVLGVVFELWGWRACVAGVLAALAIAALASRRLRQSS